MKGWVRWLRAAWPPWEETASPLVSYHLRGGGRAGQRPYGLLVLGHVILAGYVVLLWRLRVDAAQRGFFVGLDDLLGLWFSVALLAASVAYIWLALRVLSAMLARTLETIAGARSRGQWELIAITPMPRDRWYRAQLIVTSWQLFPLIRQWLASHAALILLTVGGLIVAYLARWQDYQACRVAGDCIGMNALPTAALLPPGAFLLAILPSLVLLAVGPMVQLGMLQALGLAISSHTQHTWLGMLSSVLAFYALRIGLVWGYLISGAVAVLLWEGGSGDLFSAWSLVVLYGFVAALFLAMGVEWLPLGWLLLFFSASAWDEYAWVFIMGNLTGLFAGVVAPLWLTSVLRRGTLAHLERHPT